MHCTEQAGPPAIRKVRKAGATILVIEDERFVRDVTCEILRHAGYRVLQAGSAGAGRRLFLRHGKRIRLLLCDAVLPDWSGVQLVRSLRSRSAGLKVIVASGYPRGTVEESLDRKGGNEFLAKPYGAASLVSKVKMALQEPRSTEAGTT